jgi:peptide/nickel transport system permease protein
VVNVSHSDSDQVDESSAAEHEIFSGDDTTIEVSPADRIIRMVDEYVYAPARIAWSDWRTRIGIPILVFYVLMGTVFTIIVPEPTLNQGPRYIGPFQTMQYPLGTDGLGQSIGKQIVHATPAMLKMILAGAIFASGVAVVIGLVSGFKGGIVDNVLMVTADTVMVIPGLPLILFITAIFPPKDPFLVGALLAIDSWPGLARSLRSQVLSLRENSYVEAARAQGMPTSRIITHEILPQMAPYTLINAAGAAKGVIGASVGLYFLGILPFTTFNWGVMMNLARANGALANPSLAAHWLIWPTLALSGLGFGLTLFSQGMDRVFNPRLRARHASTIKSDEDEETNQPSPMD